MPSPLLHNPPPQPGLHPCNLLYGQHMREAAERRQQLELEHEQALAVLNAKQQEIDLLQKVREVALRAQEVRTVPVSRVKDLFVAHWCGTCTPTKVKSPQRL